MILFFVKIDPEITILMRNMTLKKGTPFSAKAIQPSNERSHPLDLSPPLSVPSQILGAGPLTSLGWTIDGVRQSTVPKYAESHMKVAGFFVCFTVKNGNSTGFTVKKNLEVSKFASKKAGIAKANAKKTRCSGKNTEVSCLR